MINKRMFLALATLVVMPSIVLAQTTPTTTPNGQNATGNTGINIGANFGSPQLGAGVSGWGNAGFDPNGALLASGSAQTVGSGSGKFGSAPGKAAASAAVSVVSDAKTNGDGPNTVTVGGKATQFNGANVPNSTPMNYGWGGNATTGSYNGSTTGPGPLHVMGGGGATGKTAASLGQTPTSAIAAVQTTGESKGVLSGATGTTGANGNGAIGAAAQKVLGGSYAGGWLMGSAAYNAPGGTQFSAGFLKTAGQTTGTILPNSVSASSTVTSTAAAGSPVAPPISGAPHP